MLRQYENVKKFHYFIMQVIYLMFRKPTTFVGWGLEILFNGHDSITPDYIKKFTKQFVMLNFHFIFCYLSTFESFIFTPCVNTLSLFLYIYHVFFENDSSTSFCLCKQKIMSSYQVPHSAVSYHLKKYQMFKQQERSYFSHKNIL